MLELKLYTDSFSSILAINEELYKGQVLKNSCICMNLLKFQRSVIM